MRDLNFASLRSELKLHSLARFIMWLRANKTWAAILLLTAASLVFYFSQLGSLGSFLYRPGSQVSDLMITFWPNIAYIQQSLREFHQLPLWRTLIFSGSPFDVDPQSGLWYPPNLVFLFTPAAVGLNMLFILHTLAAGIGMWFWARTVGLSFWPALLSSLAFAFSPRAFAHLGTGHLGIVYAAAYVPWCLWAGYQLGQQRWRYAGLLGLALGWQAIAHLQIAVYTGLTVGIYALVAAFFRPYSRLSLKFKHHQRAGDPASLRQEASAPRDWKFLKVVFGGLALGALLALAVAAVLLVPLARFTPQSSRASMEIVDAGISSLPLNYLWGLIMPDYSGYMDYMLYAGVPLLVLALLALSRPQARFWGIFVVAAILYALGASTPLFQIVFRVMPLLTYVRAPSRVWLVAMAPVALLAGMGLQRLIDGLAFATQRRLNLLLVALSATGLALGGGYFALFGVPPTNLAALAVLMPATGLVVGASAARKIPWQVGGALVILLVMSDLILVDATLIESRTPGQVFADRGLGGFLALREDGQPYRVYSPSYSLPRHIAVQAGLESADGVDPIFLDSYDRFFELASGVKRQRYGVTVPAMEGPGPIELVNQDARPDANLLGLLNVRYVAAEFPIQAHALQPIARFDQTYLYENQAYLPRAFVVGSVAPVEDLDQALARIQSINLPEQALVEGGPALSNGGLQAQVNWRQRSPNRLSLQVATDKDGFLVLSQVFYPGWKVFVDGKLDRIWKADGVLSGVYLPAGEHVLVFTYQPPTLWLGLFVTGLAILICLALIAGRGGSDIPAANPPESPPSRRPGA